MFKSTFMAALGAVVALVALTGSPVQAQNTMAPGADGRAIQDQNRRTFGDRRQPNRSNRAEAAAPTAEETLAAAQTLTASAGLACQVSQANLLSVVSGESRVYEAACAVGPGYILIASTPPQTFDCVLLADAQARQRAAAAGAPAAPADPSGATEITCVMPQNTDVMRVMVDYGRQANLPCVPNQGGPTGKQIGGEELYEVGCDGVDGYVLQRLAAGGFKTTECAQVVDATLACQFSTAQEQAASLKARFAGNAEAAACDVIQARYMGANTNGAFWEARCGAGNGVIVRFNAEYAVQQVYACEVAHRIGGGCRLTVVPEAPAAEAPAAAPAAQQ